RRALHDFLPLAYEDFGTVRHAEAFRNRAILSAKQQDFAGSRRQCDVLAVLVGDDPHALELDHAALLRLVLAVDRRTTTGDAADVEGSHGELRARLADRLRGDDADGHPVFDGVAGGEVHPVAALAHAQRRLAGHRTANGNLVEAELFEFLRLRRR